MECHECRGRLLDYVAKLLRDRDRMELTQHLKHCPDCRQVLDKLKRDREKLNEWRCDSPKPGLADRTVLHALLAAENRRRRLGWGKWVAAVVAVWCVCSGYRNLRSPTRELLLYGPARFAPNATAAMRIVFRRHRGSKPVRNARVKIRLATADGRKTYRLGTFRTDGAGSVSDGFQMPDAPEGKYQLVVRAGGPFSREEARCGIELAKELKILVTTDKPLYRPGQIIHLRVLALDAVGGRPARERSITVEALDPKGNKVFKKQLTTSEFGIAAADFQLADEVNLGRYRVGAEVGGMRSEQVVTVKRYTLPKLKTEVSTAKPFYLPGETIHGCVKSEYFFGKPVMGASVELNLEVFAVKWTTVASVDGHTGVDGRLEFALPLPSSLPGSSFERGLAHLRLKCTITDTADHSETTSKPIAVSQEPILVDVVPDGGHLVPGLENNLYVLTTYPDGRPARTVVKFLGGAPTSRARTNDAGLAEIKYDCPKLGRRINVSAEDDAGHKGKAELSFDPKRHDTGFLVRTDRGIYRGGDTMRVDIVSTEPRDTIFVDLVKRAQTVLTRSVSVRGGSGTLSIDLPTGLAGTLKLHAYRIGQHGEMTRSTRLIQVLAADGVRVRVRADRSRYRPGGLARVRLSATAPDGRPTVAALGLSVVDESLLYLAEQRPGFESVHFSLEEELLKPLYQIKRFASPACIARLTDSAEGVDRAVMSIATAGLTPSIDGLLAPYLNSDPRVLAEARRALRDPRIMKWNEDLKPLAAALDGCPELLVSESSYVKAAARVRRARRRFKQVAGMGVFFALLGSPILVRLMYWLLTGGKPSVTLLDALAITAILAILAALLLPALNRAREAARSSLAYSSARHALLAYEAAKADGVLDSRPASGPTGAPRVREHFPETLYWRPQIITDERGEASVEIPLADSITTWQMAVSAVSAEGALGSTTAPLRVFQEFFVEPDLPVSATQHDELTLPVAVYNYLRVPQDVRLCFESDHRIQLLSNSVQTVRVEPNTVAKAAFEIRAVKPGQTKVTITATGRGGSDAVRRPLRIEPDGREVVTVHSGVLTGTISHRVTFPKNAIDGVNSLIVKLYPSVFSETVEGLENLFKLPYGCFEQTSSCTYPNVLVLRYLKATGQLTPEVEMKARHYINMGYQRLLTFEVSGGGFEWFGRPPANVVLTAYGILEFTDMSEVHPVDPSVIDRACQWLMRQQKRDGSWAPASTGWTWGSLEPGLAATAYVSWSLLESGRSDHDVLRGLAFMQRHFGSIQSPYVLALATNAFVAADPRSAMAVRALDRLLKLRSDDGRRAHWRGPGQGLMHARGDSLALETTALAAYALIKAGRASDTARRALIWLTEQKDGLGLLGSTQATILQLRALLSGTGQALVGGTEATVKVEIDDASAHSFAVRPENSDVVQLASLNRFARPGEHTVRLRAPAEAELAYQVIARHYLPWSSHTSATTPPPLRIAVTYDRDQLLTNDTVYCQVRVQRPTAPAADMVIVDVGVPAGFSPVASDLDRLVAAGAIAKYSIPGRQVTLYVRRISPGQAFSANFRLVARFPVRAQAAPSRAYEYYTPTNRAVAAPARLVVKSR